MTAPIPLPAPALNYFIDAWYGNKQGSKKVLDGVSGALIPGAVVSLVGLSGSGKTTLSLALLRLLQYRGGTVEGNIVLQGKELTGLSEKEMRSVRGKQIGYVPQSPAAALNGRLRVITLLEETWFAHRKDDPPAEFFAELLQSVCLPAAPEFLRKQAGSLSVGQGQRLLIALGVLHRPAVLLADEPTSALDVITQNGVLRLLRDLAARYDMATLFISHDLQAVATWSREVHILHGGRVVEVGSPGQIFQNPAHEFTRELISAIPKSPWA